MKLFCLRLLTTSVCVLFASAPAGATTRFRNSPGQRPEACLILCLSCFKSISLIIVRSQGPRWAKLGVLDNHRIITGYRCGRKIAPKSSGGALGAPQEAFLAASVADRLVHTFLEASGVHFGSHFGLKNVILALLSGPVGPFFELFFPPIFITRPH